MFTTIVTQSKYKCFFENERYHDIETLIATLLNLVPLVFAFLSIKPQTAIKISSRSFISLFSH